MSQVEVELQTNGSCLSVKLDCPYCGNPQQTINLNAKGDLIVRTCSWSFIKNGSQSCGESFVLKSRSSYTCEIFTLKAQE